jgi:hypothetical protein
MITVKIEIEVETEDYGGRELQQEIENLFLDIDPDSKLKALKIQVKDDPFPEFDYRSIDWRDE